TCCDSHIEDCRPRWPAKGSQLQTWCDEVFRRPTPSQSRVESLLKNQTAGAVVTLGASRQVRPCKCSRSARPVARSYRRDRYRDSQKQERLELTGLVAGCAPIRVKVCGDFGVNLARPLPILGARQLDGLARHLGIALEPAADESRGARFHGEVTARGAVRQTDIGKIEGFHAFDQHMRLESI